MSQTGAFGRGVLKEVKTGIDSISTRILEVCEIRQNVSKTVSMC